MAWSRVAVVSATPETILEDYSRVLTLAGLAEIASPSRPPAILLDLVWNRYQPAAGPTPWQLEGVLGALKSLHCENTGMVVGSRGTREVSPRRAADRYQLSPVLQRHQLSLTTLPGDIWSYQAPTRRAALESPLDGTIAVPAILKDRKLIYLSSLKAHASLGLSSAVGAVASEFLDRDELRGRPRVAEILADALQTARELHPELLCVIDATVCGLGAGPRRLRPSVQNLLIASRDPVAVDAVGARILGLDPTRVPFLVRCAQHDLGALLPSEIEIVGESSPVLDQTLESSSLGVPGERVLRLPQGERLRAGQRLLRRAARDFLWYPSVGRRWRKLWRRTPWGQLFQDYARSGGH